MRESGPEDILLFKYPNSDSGFRQEPPIGRILQFPNKVTKHRGSGNSPADDRKIKAHGGLQLNTHYHRYSGEISFS
jgi:hypothetical protein